MRAIQVALLGALALAPGLAMGWFLWRHDAPQPVPTTVCMLNAPGEPAWRCMVTTP